MSPEAEQQKKTSATTDRKSTTSAKPVEADKKKKAATINTNEETTKQTKKAAEKKEPASPSKSRTKKKSKAVDTGEVIGIKVEEDIAEEASSGTVRARPKRAPYQVPRTLVTWDIGKDQLLLLALVYECDKIHLDIPLEEAMQHVLKGSSSDAARQHFHKVRKARHAIGQYYPGTLAKAKKSASRRKAESTSEGKKTPKKRSHAGDDEEEDKVFAPGEPLPPGLSKLVFTPPPKRSKTSNLVHTRPTATSCSAVSTGKSTKDRLAALKFAESSPSTIAKSRARRNVKPPSKVKIQEDSDDEAEAVPGPDPDRADGNDEWMPDNKQQSTPTSRSTKESATSTSVTSKEAESHDESDHESESESVTRVAQPASSSSDSSEDEDSDGDSTRGSIQIGIDGSSMSNNGKFAMAQHEQALASSPPETDMMQSGSTLYGPNNIISQEQLLDPFDVGPYSDSPGSYGPGINMHGSRFFDNGGSSSGSDVFVGQHNNVHHYQDLQVSQQPDMMTMGFHQYNHGDHVSPMPQYQPSEYVQQSPSHFIELPQPSLNNIYSMAQAGASQSSSVQPFDAAYFADPLQAPAPVSSSFPSSRQLSSQLGMDPSFTTGPAAMEMMPIARQKNDVQPLDGFFTYDGDEVDEDLPNSESSHETY